MSPDPAAVRPGDLLNFGRYAYANANPVNYVDPDGRKAEKAEETNAKTLDQVVVHGSGGGSSGGMPSFVGTSGSRGGGEPGGGAPTLETVEVTADAPAEATTLAAVTVTAVRPLTWGVPRWVFMPNPAVVFVVGMAWPGNMAACQEPACMPGLYYPGSYANEEAPPFADNPKSAPGKFKPKGRSGAKENVDDGSIWEKDTSGQGGEQWKRWPNEKSWERGERPNSIWDNGGIRK